MHALVIGSQRVRFDAGAGAGNFFSATAELDIGDR
jgi:hypothetical protein